MTLATDWFEPFTIFWGSLAGLLLSGAWLLICRVSSPLWASRLIGGCGLLLLAAFFALVAIVPPAAIACLAFAALAAVALATHSRRASHLVHVLFRPAGICSAAFIGCVAVVLFLGLKLQRPPDDELPQQAGTDIQHAAIEGIQGATDQGRPIGFVRYTGTAGLNELEKGYLADPRYQQEIIRLARPDLACNCHGWVFTGGQFGVRGNDVERVLADNCYVLVEHPLAGDLVIHRGFSEEITHTGIVRMTNDDGVTLVESKWGPLGVYLHRPEMQPFGHRFAFYRSQRDGHRVKLNSGSPEGRSEIGQSTANGKWRRPGPMGVKSTKVRSRQS